MTSCYGDMDTNSKDEEKGMFPEIYKDRTKPSTNQDYIEHPNTSVLRVHPVSQSRVISCNSLSRINSQHSKCSSHASSSRPCSPAPPSPLPFPSKSAKTALAAQAAKRSAAKWTFQASPAWTAKVVSCSAPLLFCSRCSG